MSINKKKSTNLNKNSAEKGKGTGKSDLYREFIDKLDKLADSQLGNSGDRAFLKRAAGKSISESRGALLVFYKYLPIPLHNNRNEDIFFLISTLRFLNDKIISGNFGETMRIIKQKFESESIDARFRSLLQSNQDRIGYQLRQLVKLASSKEAGINWYHLLKDLNYWGHPSKFVQKEWARTYYKIPKKNEKGDNN